MSVGSASTLISWVMCSSTPPSLTPGASSVPSSSIATSDWIAWSRRTTWRSRWSELAAHRVPLLLLDDDGLGLAAVERQVEQGAAGGERVARLALGHAERARLGAARVDDAGDEPVAAQAAGRARAEFGAFGDLECGAIGSHEATPEDKTPPLRSAASRSDVDDEGKIPKGRVRRSAKLGSALGVQGARYAGTRAAGRRAHEGGRRGEAGGAPPGDRDPDGLGPRRDEGRRDEARPARLVRRQRVPARGVPRALPGADGEAPQLGRADAVGEGREGAGRGVRGRAGSGPVRATSSRRRSPRPRSARCTGRS